MKPAKMAEEEEIIESCSLSHNYCNEDQGRAPDREVTEKSKEKPQWVIFSSPGQHKETARGPEKGSPAKKAHMEPFSTEIRLCVGNKQEEERADRASTFCLRLGPEAE